MKNLRFGRAEADGSEAHMQHPVLAERGAGF